MVNLSHSRTFCPLVVRGSDTSVASSATSVSRAGCHPRSCCSACGKRHATRGTSPGCPIRPRCPISRILTAAPAATSNLGAPAPFRLAGPLRRRSRHFPVFLLPRFSAGAKHLRPTSFMCFSAKNGHFSSKSPCFELFLFSRVRFSRFLTVASEDSKAPGVIAGVNEWSCRNGGAAFFLRDNAPGICYGSPRQVQPSVRRLDGSRENSKFTVRAA